MLLHVVSTGADGVAACAVGAQDGGVAAEAREVVCAAGVGALVGAVEDVVGLVGGVENVAEEGYGSDLSDMSIVLNVRYEGSMGW